MIEHAPTHQPTDKAILDAIIGDLSAHLTDSELDELKSALLSSPAGKQYFVDEDARRIEAYHTATDMYETFIGATHLGDITAAPVEIEGWREKLKSVPLPLVTRPEGIARAGQRTVLKAERKTFSDRLRGSVVAGRRLNRADRRFVAGQIRFA